MILSRHPDQSLHVLVVWEPIRPTDWTSPGGGTLARIFDSRARQFWDPKHLVSRDLTRFMQANPSQPAPNCCKDNGFFWDTAILYPAHSSWTELPAATFWDGPVWRISPRIESAIQAQP